MEKPTNREKRAFPRTRICSAPTIQEHFVRFVYSRGLTYPILSRLSLILMSLLICLTACAPGTGIFAGGRWQPGGLQRQHIRALAVDPNNLQNIYSGDAQNGVFASTDAGMHWSQRSTGLPMPVAIHSLAFDGPGKKLYAVTDAGIYASADGAQHWTVITGLPSGSYSALAFDLKAPHTIYTAAEHQGVLVSTNDGSSWTTASGGLPSGMIINGLAFDTDQHQLWAATNMGIYRSSNGGIAWQALNNGLPAAVVVYTVLPASINGGVQGLVFAGTNQGLFLSQDGGARWTRSQETLSGTSVYAILIDYRQASTVYVAISIGVLRSDDSGQNWRGVASGLPKGQPVYALALGSNGYNQLYAADNDVYLYPGNSSIFDPSQLVPFLLIIIGFLALYRLTAQGRKRSRETFRPKQVDEIEKSRQQE
jgi:photosystem II stability/assembly factor-like uncharacterized protein